MIGAVLDSSVLVSAFLTPSGVADQLLQHAACGTFVLYLSPQITDEVRRSLREKTERIRRYYSYTDERVDQFIAAVVAVARSVTELPELHAVPLDPADDMVIATAVAAGADYLVTGDLHLLSLREHDGIRIVRPKAFLDLLSS
jgi:uncharacterized protein